MIPFHDYSRQRTLHTRFSSSGEYFFIEELVITNDSTKLSEIERQGGWASVVIGADSEWLPFKIWKLKYGGRRVATTYEVERYLALLDRYRDETAV
jgi:hypothetical protein